MKNLFFLFFILFLLLGLLYPKFWPKIIHRIKAPGLVRYDAKTPVLPHHGVAIFTASSLDRIFQDGKTLLKPDFQISSSISLARNEYRSFQIVIQTQDRFLKSIEVHVDDLVHKRAFKNIFKGPLIDKHNISIRIVGFVKTEKPYYPVKYVGPWPDPLLPAHTIDIQPHRTQPFWITVYVPPETAAGDYTAPITILSAGKVLQSVPLSVHVYNFDLPQASHLKTAFDFYGHITKIRYPQGVNESDRAYQVRINGLNDQFIRMMLQYRMDPILNIDPSSQDELSGIDRYLTLGLNNFSIGKRGGSFDNNWPKDDATIESLLPMYQEYGEDLKLNDMLPYHYIYLWDEGDMGNPIVAKIASMIHRAYPGLRTMVCFQGFWDIHQGSDWLKDIDIWCFQIDHFDERKMRQLQTMGKEIWMYVSGPSGASTPNLDIDFDSIDYRIIPWICWKYDIQGFLYWCVNWWPRVDPFVSAQNSEWEQNGNGLLFYPGKDGPVASIRDELFREGMEDYEYMQRLFEDLKILKDKNWEKKYPEYFKEGIRLMTIDKSIAASMSDFSKNGNVLEERRRAIAHQIEIFSLLK